MTRIISDAIATDLPTEVLTALAEACGFCLFYDSSSDEDRWTLSHGHGDTHVRHVGTRAAVCAFLSGYADMQLLTTQILNEIDNAQRRFVLDMRARLGR